MPLGGMPLHNKHQTTQYCHYFKTVLSTISSMIHFFIMQMLEPKITDWKDETNNRSNIFYFIYFNARKTFR